MHGQIVGIRTLPNDHPPASQQTWATTRTTDEDEDEDDDEDDKDNVDDEDDEDDGDDGDDEDDDDDEDDLVVVKSGVWLWKLERKYRDSQVQQKQKNERAGISKAR